MRFNWRGWSMFVAGLLLGGLGAGVLFAPPELGEQPAPWDRSAREAAAAAATHAAGAGPAQPAAVAVQAASAASASALPASAALAAASQPASASVAPAAPASASAQASASPGDGAKAEAPVKPEPAAKPEPQAKSEVAKAEPVTRPKRARKVERAPDEGAETAPRQESVAHSEAAAPRHRRTPEPAPRSAVEVDTPDAVLPPPEPVSRGDTSAGPPAAATGNPNAGDAGPADLSQ